MKRAFLLAAAAAWVFGQSPDGWRRIGESRGNIAPALTTAAVPPEQAPPQQPPAQAPPPATQSTLTLPAGTYITVHLNEPMSAKRNKSGEPFVGIVAQPVVGEGYVIAQPGQMVDGRIVESERGSRAKDRQSVLRLELTGITAANGRQVPVRTELIQHGAGSNAGQDALTMGTSIGMGAAVGAAAGGGLGAGIGAAAGALVSAIAVLATPGKAAEIHPEDTLTFRIVESVNVPTDGSLQAFQQAPRYQQQPVQQQPPQPRQLARRPPPPYGYPYPYYYPPPPPPYYYGPGIVIYGGRYRRW